MTVLPSARVKLPVCESSTVMSVPLIASLKPVARSVAADDPVVPSRTTRLVGVFPKLSATHFPAVSPSFLKSRPTQLAYRSFDADTVRSSRITGMLASLASFSTSSQPSVTIGASTMASTPWLMKLRTAAICASGLLSAALKMRLKPFSVENAVFIDSVLALRQPLSEPVWAKPTVMTLSSPPPPAVEPPPAQPVAVRAIAPTSASPARVFFAFMLKPPRFAGCVAGVM